MSFRNTFVTDFIYAAGEELEEDNKKVEEVFKEYTSLLTNTVGNNGMGFYSGIIGTLSLGRELEELDLANFTNDLAKVTKIPFRITIMQESGAVITYNIEPRKT